jgi:hypothetical protein
MPQGRVNNMEQDYLRNVTSAPSRMFLCQEAHSSNLWMSFT